MTKPIGTCSLCGGPVVCDRQVVEPIPTCSRCGAVAKEPYGPTIPMTNPKPPWPPEMSTEDYVKWLDMRARGSNAAGKSNAHR